MGSLLGSGAPVPSDFVVFVGLGIAVMLVAGMFVVRRGHVGAHKYIQSPMVLVNIPVVLSWMVPQYLANVLPGLPHEIADPFYLVPPIMLLAGGIAEALGTYILLVAGTNLLPERFRFRRYKLWMRSELILWWLVLLAGFTTYYVWYVPH